MKRVVELDGLRGFLCLGVVLYHVHHQWLFWFWSVMDYFFMASGFVISAQLILNRNAENLLSAFFMRRALRVWPLYFATFLFGLLVYAATSDVNVWGATQARGWLQFATFTAFVEGYLAPLKLAPYPFHFIHAWSVSVEEQFYVVFALSFFLMRRWTWSVPAIAVAFIATGLWWRGQHTGHLYLLLNHIDALGWGLLLSQMFCSGVAERTRKVLLPLFAGCAVLSVPMWAGYLWQGYAQLGSDATLPPVRPSAWVNAGFILTWLGLIGAIALTPGKAIWAPLRSRFARYLGDISYPLYLTHYMAIVLMIVAARKLGMNAQVFAVLGAIVGIAAAHVIHVRIEKPLSRFKAGMRYRVPGEPQPERKSQRGLAVATAK